MNQAEKKAREGYERNKLKASDISKDDWKALSLSAKQQDAFYKIFNERADKKINGH